MISGLLLRVMSLSVALLQLRSVLMSIPLVTSEGHLDIHGLHCSLTTWISMVHVVSRGHTVVCGLS